MSLLQMPPTRYVPSLSPETSSQVADGLAIRTEPPAGATLAPGSEISLFISIGS